MTVADVAEVLAVQEPGAVRALREVFPQDEYPFPREAVAVRWRREIADPAVDCYVVLLEGAVSGFAALRGDEVAHFGVSVALRGSGLAATAHDELVRRMAERGCRRAWLHVYAGNPRARRFYQRLGWRRTGVSRPGPVPPYAEMLRYERDLPSPAR